MAGAFTLKCPGFNRRCSSLAEGTRFLQLLVILYYHQLQGKAPAVSEKRGKKRKREGRKDKNDEDRNKKDTRLS